VRLVQKTRAWLDAQGIDYENRDVETNAEWAEEITISPARAASR
jgi:hypothetical protein